MAALAERLKVVQPVRAAFRTVLLVVGVKPDITSPASLASPVVAAIDLLTSMIPTHTIAVKQAHANKGASTEI